MDNLAERVADEDEEGGFSAKKMIKDECYSTYELQLEAIWWQLVRLNSNIYILEKILAFPFEEFFLSHELNFWNLTAAALSESSVSIAYGIGIDTDDDILSIDRLKNAMSRNNTGYLKKEFRLRFKHNWKENSKGKNHTHIKRKIKELRDKQFAHFNRDWNLSLSVEEKHARRLALDELKHFCDYLNVKFDVLSVGTHYQKLFGSYASQDHPSDIETILEAILRVNPIVNMPEEQSAF